MAVAQLRPDARAGDRTASAAGPDRRRPTPGRDRTSVLNYLRAQRRELAAAEAAVRAGGAEGVHDLRVAVRRLRSTLRTFGPLLRPDVPVGLADELRWLGHRFGAARDQEVLLERLRADLAELPAELVLGPVAARLDEEYLPRLLRARGEALEALDGERYRAVLTELDRLLDAPAKARPGPSLRKLVRRARRTAVRRAEAGLALPGGADRDVALHRARRAAKRARYAAEAAVPTLGRRAARVARRAEAVQDVLGRHQDDVVAFAELRRLGAAGAAAGENGFTAGLLAGRIAARAERVGVELAPPLRRLARARL